jgi:hypothetical protein
MKLKTDRLCALFGAVFAFGIQAGVAAEKASSIENAPYPGVIALSQDSTGWIYRSFPQFLPLYTFKGEPASRSLCDRSCTAVWPIIQAREGDKPMGDWTVLKREDGRFQWMYKNSPVHTYFEDRTNEPKGDGKDMGWYLDERVYAYLASAGVEVSSSPINTRAKKAEAKKTEEAQVKAQLLLP